MVERFIDVSIIEESIRFYRFLSVRVREGTMSISMQMKPQEW